MTTDSRSLVATTERFAQYLDPESGVVTKPEGEGWDDFYGDAVWRSSWLFASLLAIRSGEPATYERLQREQGLDVVQGEHFLRFFRDHCTGGDEWKIPKNDSQRFSGDQLAPLLYLVSSVYAYGSDAAKAVARDLLQRLIGLDERIGALSSSSSGTIRDNQRYVIDINCRMYDIDYLSGPRRDVCKGSFSAALKANNFMAQLPWEELATMDDYSVFNALAVVSVACVKWGKDDDDVDAWRSNYRLHADRGWGPSFRIVAGRSLEDSSIEDYYTAHITREMDNDIIMAQRPHRYLKGDFGPQLKGGPGQWLVLDYVILKGLRLIWG
ncbi:hypothetical protein OJF2_78930 (plasmid) [Aquisphaera giovannonii]|uniref:Uncharacterized protein n=1 Tax=Aquisphaera giovannonii TaxID=406548 RepID=A0A5B9WF78_9BACT|nr:hypothetical protein [Aquisphaera giovannonii]QEH39278.1 hypothetical protein OJF2_78930 [Aquisphaera giovannonii]